MRRRPRIDVEPPHRVRCALTRAPLGFVRAELVHPEAARAAAGGYPQAVLITLSDPAGETVYPGVLLAICEPSTGDLQAEAREAGLGLRGRRRLLTAWLQELPPEHRGQKCGWRPYVESIPPLAIPSGAWRASEVVFEHEDGHDSAYLVLAPP